MLFIYLAFFDFFAASVIPIGGKKTFFQQIGRNGAEKKLTVDFSWPIGINLKKFTIY